MQTALVKDDFIGYTLADAFARYALPVGALSLGVQNLFDQPVHLVQFRYDLAGRSTATSPAAAGP
jgi:outer membrane receptor protein involved in Fe transport